MKDLKSVISLNFMHHGEGALCYLAQTLFVDGGGGGDCWGVIQNSLMSLGVRKKMSQSRKICNGSPVTL